MDQELRRIEWHEETTGRGWTCRFRTRSTPGCSIIATFLGAPVLLFLIAYGPHCAGGGVFPALGVLEMALPLALIGLIALRDDRDGQKHHRILLDRDRLRYLHATGEESVVPAAELGELVAVPFAVEARDHQGNPLLLFYTSAPTFLCKRLQAALDRLREPLTYRA